MVWSLAAALAAGILQRADVLSGAFGLLLCFTYRRRPSRVASALTVLLCLCLYGYGHRESAGFESRCAALDSTAIELGGNAIVLEGVVAGFPAWSTGGTRFDFSTSIDGRPQRLRLKVNRFDIAFGDSLAVFARIDSPGRMRRSDYLRGIGATGSARVRTEHVKKLAGRGGHVVTRDVLWPLHDTIRGRLVRGCGTSAGVPVALVLGERGYLPAWVRDAFSVLGISHLLALSGFHLGFVSLAVLGLMNGLRIRNRALLVLLLLLYVGTVGFILSLYRALVMVIIMVVTSRVRRPLRPVTALADAFLLMLLACPQALFSLGFQLSFMATFAVLLCVERMAPVTGASRLRKFAGGVWATLWMSAVVQLWVAPLLLYNFGGVSVVAPVATAVFVVPIVVVLSLSGLAAIVVGIHSGAGAVAFAVLGIATEHFLSLLRLAISVSPRLAEMPMPFLPVYLGGIWVALTVRRKLWITVTASLAAAASCVIPFFLR